VAAGKHANMILDDGGDATLLADPRQPGRGGSVRHCETRERRRDGVYARSASVSRRNRAGTGSPAAIRGVTEETTTGVKRLYRMAAEDKLPFPPSTSTTCHEVKVRQPLRLPRESLVDGIKRATDVMIAGKITLVAGYGDVGKGCARSRCADSARPCGSPKST
jgi:adenosylhomocysteinase